MLCVTTRIFIAFNRGYNHNFAYRSVGIDDRYPRLVLGSVPNPTSGCIGFFWMMEYYF